MTSMNLESLNTFGELLRHLRRRARLTQRDLGIAVGYSEAHIGRLESNERRPEVATVSTLFVEALDLKQEPRLADRLIELAKVAHGASRGSLERPAQRVRSNLPAQLTRFVGRAREIAEITRLINAHRLVTLTGTGGIGKTRLAVEAGHALVDQYPQGIWLVQLAPVIDGQHVPQALASTLRVSESEGHSYLDAVTDYLEHKPALLILDNCEHLIVACAASIEHLLQRCPLLHVLATSRESLKILGEQLYPVPPLTLPHSPHGLISAEDAIAFEAVQLFVERIRMSDCNFEMTESNVGQVIQICRALEGIPLALELTAGLAQTMTLGEMVGRLANQHPLPATEFRTADPRHQTMRSVLDWSFKLLTPLEQRLLARLTVFHSSWTAEAAEAVCGEVSVPILEHLHHLVQQSLVVSFQHNLQTRFRMLEPVCQYADEKLHEMREWEKARYRHMAFFTEFAEYAETGLMGFEHGRWLNRLEADYENLMAALTWSRDHPDADDFYVRMTCSLWRYWLHRREYREGKLWMEGALERTKHDTTAQRIKVLSGSLWLILQEDIPRAARLAEECLQHARETGDSLNMGIALCVFAFQARAYEPAQEIQLFEESVRAFRRTSDVWLTANVIRFLGWALLDQDIDRAKQLVQESFDLWEKMGSAHGMCAALDNLGRIALSRGEHAQAYAFFERSLSYAQETGYLELIASSLDGLSRADRQQFIEYSEQRLSELRKSGKTKDIATTLHAVGVSILDLGDYERAETIFQECLHLWKQLGGYSLRVPNVAWTLVELGHSARHRGKLHQAIAHYAEAVDASHAANGVYATTEVHFYLGYAYLLQHHYEKAEQHMRDGLINWLREMEPIVPTAALLIAAMARVAHVQGNASRSARLAGAATAHLTDSMLAEIRPIEQQDFDCLISTVRVLLENPDNAHAWAEGAALTLKQAVEYALEA